jgi:hypothetical protein
MPETFCRGHTGRHGPFQGSGTLWHRLISIVIYSIETLAYRQAYNQ